LRRRSAGAKAVSAPVASTPTTSTASCALLLGRGTMRTSSRVPSPVRSATTAVVAAPGTARPEWRVGMALVAFAGEASTVGTDTSSTATAMRARGLCAAIGPASILGRMA
jgi:hypothetical protein